MLASEAMANQAMGLYSINTQPRVRVVTVTSGKGGVGKTSISTNLAVALANSGQKVLLLDADMGLANVDVLLGLNARYNLSHVMDGSHTLDDIIVEGPAGIRVIPASSGVQAMANMGQAGHAGLINAFSGLSFHPDVLLIDTAAGISTDVVTYARASHEVIVVVCDEPASITDAYATIKVLNRDHGIYRFRILANMVPSSKECMDPHHKLLLVTDRFLEVTLDYMDAIPFDEDLRKAIQRQRAVIDCYPRSKAAMSFQKAVSRVKQWPQPDAARGCIEFFVESLFKPDAATEMGVGR